jgi:hypothetical protein
MAFMYISEWDLHGAATTTSVCAAREKYTPRDMAFHVIYQNGIYTVQTLLLPPAACATREKYTPGHGIPMYISEWIYTVQRCDYYQQPATRRNIHPGTWHSLHISEWDLHGAARTTTSSLCRGEMGHGISIYQNGIYTVHARLLPQQLVPQGRNIHPGTWHSSMYISEWDLHGAAVISYHQQLCTTEKYTPGVAPPHISEWDLHGAACDYYQQLAAREKYTQGHGIPPYISEWDLHGAAPDYYQQLVPQGRKYTPRDMAFYVYQNGIYTVQRCDYYQQLVPQGRNIILGHGIPPCIYQNGICTVPPLPTTSSLPQGEIYTPGHGIPL